MNRKKEEKKIKINQVRILTEKCKDEVGITSNRK